MNSNESTTTFNNSFESQCDKYLTAFCTISCRSVEATNVCISHCQNIMVSSKQFDSHNQAFLHSFPHEDYAYKHRTNECHSVLSSICILVYRTTTRTARSDECQQRVFFPPRPIHHHSASSSNTRNFMKPPRLYILLSSTLSLSPYTRC